MNGFFDYMIKYVQLIKITDILDIVIVAVVIYQLLKMIRETRAVQLVKGIALIFVLLQVSGWMNFTTVNYILKNIMQVGLFSIVVIFQPELRSLLERMGRSKFKNLIDFSSSQKGEYEISGMISEIVSATVNMSHTKTGALIVLERETKLGDIARTGTILDAAISASLLENIFVHNTPLHDGAVIIREDKIYAAACVLPLTSNSNLSRELGTRHRAAIGISESSDAAVIVVSEETGKISIALNGTLTRNLNENTLKNAIERAVGPKPRKKTSDFEKIKFWKGAK